MIDNPWVVGILGGIPSGIIVWSITSLFSYFINRKHYYTKLRKINIEITNLLIMSVSEEKIPHYKIIESILESTARMNNLKIKDIKTVEQTYNDLIRAVYETNFIAIDKKLILSNEVEKRKVEYLEVIHSSTQSQSIVNIQPKFKSKLYLESLVTVLATFATLGAFYSFLAEDLTSLSDINEEIIAFLMSAFVSLFSAMTVSMFFKKKTK